MTGIASLFSDSPTGPAQNVKFRQGVIINFNQNTLDNQVLVGGTIMDDLPILGVGEATLLIPGSVVGILVVGEDEGAKTMFILGRSVLPNTPDATNAITLLNSQVFSAFILDGEQTSSASYTDLATIGPQVVVPVGPSGRILIIASAQVQFSQNANDVDGGGFFDVVFAGANVRSINEVNDPLVGAFNIDDTLSGGILNNRLVVNDVTAQAIFSGLNPGNTIITMKYRTPVSASTPSDFHRRALTVIKL